MHTTSCLRWRPLVGGAALLLLAACGKKQAEPTGGADLSQATGIFGAATSAQPNPAAVAITVNGKKITFGEIQAEMQKNRGRTGNVLPPQQAANNLILRLLLQQAVEKEQIVIPAADLTAAVESIRKQIPSNTTLAAVLQQHGMSEKDFRASLVYELQVARLVDKHVPKNMTATDAELAQFVKETPGLLQVPERATVRHIFVATAPGADAAAFKTQQERANKIRQQLLQGAKFEKLAAALSDDPDKVKGGLLPPFARGQIADKDFENAAFTQKPGSIGPVIKTQWGFQILQVQERQPARTFKFEEVKDKLRQLVVQQKRQKALQAYVDSLRSQAKVVFTQPAK